MIGDGHISAFFGMIPGIGSIHSLRENNCYAIRNVESNILMATAFLNSEFRKHKGLEIYRVFAYPDITINRDVKTATLSINHIAPICNSQGEIIDRLVCSFSLQAIKGDP